MKMRTLITLIGVAACGLAQTPPQIPSTVELMQTRGAINTALAQIAPIACVGTPGNTTGAYGQQCQTTLGARYSCNNAAGCTVAADWVFSGSMSWPSGAGIAVYNGSGGWGTSLSPSAFEPALGNPGVSGYVLSSTTGGVRSWVAQSGGGGGTWGSITGTLSSQTDLASALSGKQATLSAYSTISSLSGYPSTFPPTNSGDWAGTWGTHAASYFQTAISGAPGTWPTLGTAASHAAGDFEAALGNPSVSGYVLSSTTGGARSWVAQSGGGGGTWGSITGTLSSQTDLASALSGKQATLSAYSTISSLSGYPSTFPPTNSGDWAGTWGTHAASYFQTAISGAPGTWPTLGTASSHAATDFQTAGMVDILRFGLCYPAGCGSESTINYEAPLANGTFSFCAFNLAIAPNGSSVIADVRDASGVSIFGATQLVVPVGSTSVVTQATFANSPQTFSSTDKFMAIITQNDSGNTAQGGLIQCR
jgi:hypothetical protein